MWSHRQLEQNTGVRNMDSGFVEIVSKWTAGKKLEIGNSEIPAEVRNEVRYVYQ
jgi:hypothetical protein